MRRPIAVVVTALVAAALLGTVSVQGVQGASAVVPVPPAGFSDTLVASVPSPTAVTFTPDGRMLITTQPGLVRIDVGGALLPTPALDLSARTCTDRERGMQGIAVDPEFPTNHYVYIYYTFDPSGVCSVGTPNAPYNRLSRFVLGDNQIIDPATERVLIDAIPAPEGVHNGGDVHFGKDGFLYVSTGDGGCDYAADSGCFLANDASRDLHALVGKILRITAAGGIPPGNPYVGAGTARCNVEGRTTPGTKCQETFASGLRNPFRIAFDPNAPGTRFFVNDVGEQTWEEIDLGAAGADYGWNVREGNCAAASTTDCGPAPAGMTNPIFTYAHGPEQCNAITGGAFVPNGVWPAEYDGDYLFSDYTCGKIFRLEPAGGGGYAASEWESGLGVGSAIDLTFGPAGGSQGLYYATFQNNGEVRVIQYTASANRRPTAVLTASPTSGKLPLAAQFDGSGSVDPDAGDTLTYVWSFGDASPPVETSSPTVGHTYTAFGTYTAQLVVRDNGGATSPPVTVRIDAGNEAPTPTIVAPSPSQTFAVGEQITLSGTGVDPEDGQLPGSALTWEVLLHHDNHTHPFLQPTQGATATIVGPMPEDIDATNTSYLEVRLTATDSRGTETRVTRSLLPTTVPVSLGSQPSGISIAVNSVPKTTPQNLVSWQGYGLTLAAPATASVQGSALAFDRWSDGVTTPTRQVTTPAGATAYTAIYRDLGNAPAFGITASADDGDLERGTAAYPPPPGPTTGGSTTDTLLGVRRSRVSDAYFPVSVALLRFDTSAIPDTATITGASLVVRVAGKSTSDGRSLVAEWYAASNWPIGDDDWTNTIASTALTGTSLSSLTVGQDATLPLTNLTQVSRTGFTALRLGLDGAAQTPSGANDLFFASFDHPSLPEPRLVVTYTTGGAPTPPSNTSLPTITGTAQQGQTLTATDGTWSGTQPITFTRQWRRCNSGGASCSDITGATGSTYVLAAADVGSTIRVRVTATNAAGSNTADSAQSAVVTAQATSQTVTFSITAGGDDGDVGASGPQSSGYPPSAVSANPAGTVTTVGRRLAFGEFDVLVPLLRFDTSSLPDGATIASATLRLYVNLKQDQDNRSLQAEWYPGSNWPIDTADYSLSSTSTALPGTDITAIPTGQTTDFALTGPANVSTTGQTALRLHLSGGAPAGDNYLQLSSFEHATLPEAQLVVTYTLGSATAPANTAPPAITGTAQQGQTLTASDGTWTGTQPITFTRQWRRCDTSGAACADIAGATATTYLVGAADTGSTIRIRVNATNTAGNASADSTQTAVVAAAPAAPSNTAPPTITGTAQQGQTLTATDGTWTGTQPITFTRQWRRCDTSGANCTNIAGATASTYVPSATDVGSTIRIRVTATNTAGNATADSAQTGVVAGQSSATITFSIAAGGDDGDAGTTGRQRDGYPPSTVSASATDTTLTVGRRRAAGNFEVRVPLLRFDTAALPDGATITSATLRIHVIKKQDQDNRSLQVEWYPASGWPIDGADYALDSSGNALAATDITAIATGQVSGFSLTGLGNVSTTGFTALRLHLSGGQPSGDNYLQLAAFEHATLPQAELVVTYTVP
jgi:glucose/arabinose dehydrogenase/PKD repeat protein